MITAIVQKQVDSLSVGGGIIKWKYVA
jgi:hypothetical protein